MVFIITIPAREKREIRLQCVIKKHIYLKYNWMLIKNSAMYGNLE